LNESRDGIVLESTEPSRWNRYLFRQMNVCVVSIGLYSNEFFCAVDSSQFELIAWEKTDVSSQLKLLCRHNRGNSTFIRLRFSNSSSENNLFLSRAETIGLVLNSKKMARLTKVVKIPFTRRHNVAGKVKHFT